MKREELVWALVFAAEFRKRPATAGERADAAQAAAVAHTSSSDVCRCGAAKQRITVSCDACWVNKRGE
jgi:hypothetical protein